MLSPPESWAKLAWNIVGNETNPALEIQSGMRERSLWSLADAVLQEDEKRGLLPSAGWMPVAGTDETIHLRLADEYVRIGAGTLGRIEIWCDPIEYLPRKLWIQFRPIGKTGLTSWYDYVCYFDQFETNAIVIEERVETKGSMTIRDSVRGGQEGDSHVESRK
jgi:hypothetical protein